MTRELVMLAFAIALLPTVILLGVFTATFIAGRRLVVDAHAKLDHITVLTNSTLTAANKRIDELERLVRHLLGEREKVGDATEQYEQQDKDKA